MNCCDVVSNQFQVFDMMHVVLLVIQDLSQFKNKHEPVAISVAVDDSRMRKESWTLFSKSGLGAIHLYLPMHMGPELEPDFYVCFGDLC